MVKRNRKLSFYYAKSVKRKKKEKQYARVNKLIGNPAHLLKNWLVRNGNDLVLLFYMDIQRPRTKGRKKKKRKNRTNNFNEHKVWNQTNLGSNFISKTEDV